MIKIDKKLAEIYLDTLVSEKLLELNNGNYTVIKIKALSLIADYQLDKKRHRDMWIMQVMVIFLTLIMIICTSLDIYFR